MLLFPISLFIFLNSLIRNDAFILFQSPLSIKPKSYSKLDIHSQIIGAEMLVNNLEDTKKLYHNTLGLPVLEKSDSKSLLIQLIPGVQIKFKQFESKEKYEAGEHFEGIGIVSNKAAEQLHKLSQLNDVELLWPLSEYILSASLIPDEEENTETKIRCSKLKDRDGIITQIFDKDISETHCRLVLRILDTEETAEFYKSVFDMNLLRKRSHIGCEPTEACFRSIMGDKNEDKGPVLEFVYHYSTEDLDEGNNQFKLLISVDNLEELKANLNKKKIKFEIVNQSVIFKDLNGLEVLVKRQEY